MVEKTSNRTHPGAPYVLIRSAVAVVLLIAVGLKSYQFGTKPTLLLDSQWFTISIVEFELLLGLWLLFGVLARIGWAITIFFFLLLAIRSLTQAFSGQNDCGCFGSIISVSPWYTAGFDALIVLSLSFVRPAGFGPDWNLFAFFWRDDFHAFRLNSLIKPISLWLILGITAALAISLNTGTVLSETGDILGDGKLVILEPTTWLGKRFPLLDYIEESEQLRRGKWLILFFHHDCPKCQTAMTEYKELAQLHRDNPDLPRVAFIEMPPYGQSEIGPAVDPAVFFRRLRDDRQWFIETPFVQELVESIAVGVQPQKH